MFCELKVLLKDVAIALIKTPRSYSILNVLLIGIHFKYCLYHAHTFVLYEY